MSYFNVNKTGLKIPVAAVTVILIGLFLLVPSIRAERATIEEMDQTCDNYLKETVYRQGDWAGSQDPQVRDVQEFIGNDTVLAMVYNISPDGFVVVPVLKNISPVKFYSEEGYLDASETEGLVQLMREILQHRIRLFIDNFGSIEASQDPAGLIFGPENLQEWETYTLSDKAFQTNLQENASADVQAVGPLLTTRWHQGAPYNNYCPMGDGDRCVVGCVATAAAQLMAYHQWPKEGEGSESYFWGGDQSCEGTTTGKYLDADFSDPYDWDNIPDDCESGCTDEQEAALAELSYEIGVAFNMDYGACGSAIYSNQLNFVMQQYYQHFHYSNQIARVARSMFTANSWFQIIQQEINADRPTHYFIDAHSIVCDGWRISGELNQYHVNYGWGGTYNSWFTVDHLPCATSGCDYMNEEMYINVKPDMSCYFEADTTVGFCPFEVNFDGISDLTVDTWTWDFGDGEFAYEQNPMHMFNSAGAHEITLEVDAGGSIHDYTKTNYIIALADTVDGNDVSQRLNDTAEIIVNLTNSIPLYRMQVPIEYDGPVTLQYTGYSVEGCRAESFDNVTYINYDGNNKRFTLDFFNGAAPELSPGTGPLVILKFKITGSDPIEKVTTLTFDGYTSYQPIMYSTLAQYTPYLGDATVTALGCCEGMTGNTNCSEDETPDISDIVRLIDYLYLTKDPLCCPEEANTNGEGGAEPDISDIVRIIDFLYLETHTPPVDCPE